MSALEIHFDSRANKHYRDDLMLKGGRSLIECFFFMSDVTALSGGIEYAKIVSLGRIGASQKT